MKKIFLGLLALIMIACEPSPINGVVTNKISTKPHKETKYDPVVHMYVTNTVVGVNCLEVTDSCGNNTKWLVDSVTYSKYNIGDTVKNVIPQKVEIR